MRNLDLAGSQFPIFLNFPWVILGFTNHHRILRKQNEVVYWSAPSRKTQVCQNEKDGDMECQKKEMQLADDEDFGSHCLGKSFIILSYEIGQDCLKWWWCHHCSGKWRTWMWNVMEYPWTSQTARSVKDFVLSFIFIFLWIMTKVIVFVIADFHW